MGRRQSFLKILFVFTTVVSSSLFFSPGLGRREVMGIGTEEYRLLTEYPREMIEVTGDYQWPRANTNPKIGNLLNPPPPPPQPQGSD